MLVLDKYAYENRMRYVAPAKKLVLYICLLGIAFSGILGLQIAMMAILMPLTCYVARLNWKVYSKWYVVTLPFILLSFVTFIMTFAKSTEHLVWSVSLFDGYLGVDQRHLGELFAILLRIYSSLTATYFFVLIVPFQQIIELLRQCKVPAFLLDIILLMYRFIFIFLYEFIVMRDTLDLKFSFVKWRQNYHALALLANNLFAKLIKDYEHLSQVLALRFDDDSI